MIAYIPIRTLQSAQPSTLFVYVATAKQHTHMLLYGIRNGGSIVQKLIGASHPSGDV